MVQQFPAHLSKLWQLVSSQYRRNTSQEFLDPLQAA
jgi:hypothetical protein